MKTNESGKKRSLIAAVITFLSICAAAFIFDYICPFRRLTGFPCPGCGMTRAYAALLHGDIAGAFGYHPLFWLAPALTVTAALYTSHSTKRREVILLTLCAAFIAVWIIRILLGWRG